MNELSGYGWIDKRDYAGKKVTLNDMIEVVKRGAPAQKVVKSNAISLSDGTHIPF